MTKYGYNNKGFLSVAMSFYTQISDITSLTTTFETYSDFCHLTKSLDVSSILDKFQSLWSDTSGFNFDMFYMLYNVSCGQNLLL